MPTRNISLTDHLDRFIERRVATGQYGNASEIVREALRLLEGREEERAEKLKALRKAARDGFAGIDQGQGIVLETKEAIDALLDEVASTVGNSKSKGKQCGQGNPDQKLIGIASPRGYPEARNVFCSSGNNRNSTMDNSDRTDLEIIKSV